MGHRRRLVPRRVVALHPQPAAAADQRAVIIDHAPIEQDRAIADAADRAALDIGDRPDRGAVGHIMIVIGVYLHTVRPEERRVGKEFVSTLSTRWSPQ